MTDFPTLSCTSSYEIPAPSYTKSLKKLLLLGGVFPYKPLKVVPHWIKVAKQSFRSMHLLMPFSVRARIANNKRSFYLLNACTICVYFFKIEHSELNDFSSLLQRYVRKGNNAKNPEILRLFFIANRTS